MFLNEKFIRIKELKSNEEKEKENNSESINININSNSNLNKPLIDIIIPYKNMIFFAINENMEKGE